MNASTLLEHLEAACEDEDDFPYALHDLVAELPRDGAGLALMPTIFEFMERHPELDYGAPGPLVHYMERFYGAGYDELLVESVKRRPIAQTLGMLNALFNGVSSKEKRHELMELNRKSMTHPLADADARDRAERYAERHAKLFALD